jgi:hypothetical protein
VIHEHDFYRSKSPIIPYRKQLIENPYADLTTASRNIQSESRKKRVELIDNKYASAKPEIFVVEHHVEEGASVKFNRAGMKVVSSVKQDENSFYDPNAHYDDIASKYDVDLPNGRNSLLNNSSLSYEHSSSPLPTIS